MNVNKAFDALEIEKTTDKKLIKKAYAVLSRKYHPEEHPQKWKEVHEAYKIAINYADNEAEDGKTSIFGEQDFGENDRESTEDITDILSNKNEQQDMKQLFENIEELSEESKIKVAEENKAQLALAMQELYALRGKRKQTVDDWQKIFSNEAYRWVIRQDAFLMDVGRAVEGIEISREVYQYLQQQLNYIKQYRQTSQKESHQEGIISGIAFAERKIDSSYRGRKEERKRKIKLFFLIVSILASMILRICSELISYESRAGKKEEIQGTDLVASYETARINLLERQKYMYEVILQNSCMNQDGEEEKKLEGGVQLLEGIYLSDWTSFVESETDIFLLEQLPMEDIKIKDRELTEENACAYRISTSGKDRVAVLGINPALLGFSGECDIYYYNGKKYKEISKWNFEISDSDDDAYNWYPIGKYQIFLIEIYAKKQENYPIVIIEK